MSDRWRRRPLYSACNEDARTELAALAPARGDVAVCVAAGGGRALALLGGGARLLAIDRRESQLHVLELKAVALEALPYPRFRGFLGVDADGDRLDAYAQLRSGLTRRARRYWDRRRSLVARGVLYAGRLESTLARWAGWLRRSGAMRWPDAAFAATSLDEQRAVLTHAADSVMRGAAWWRSLFHPACVALALQDPSFSRSTEGRIGAYLYARMVEFATRRLLRESALLHLIWYGRYDPHGALPLWLTPEGAEQARKHLPQLELRCVALERVTRALPRDAPLCWSLSDVSAWMSAGAFQALLEGVVAASPPGSRLCWRHLAAHWPLAPIAGLRVDPAAARALGAADRSVFYAIGIGTVLGSGDTAPAAEWKHAAGNG